MDNTPVIKTDQKEVTNVNLTNDDKEYVHNVVELIKDMDQTTKAIEDKIASYIRNEYGLKIDIINKVIAYDDAAIEKLTDVQIDDILKEYSIENNLLLPSSREERINLLKVVKDSAVTIFKAKLDCKEIKSEVKNMIDETIEKVSNLGIKSNLDNTVKRLTEEIQKETDPEKKSSLERELKKTENAISLSLLIERFTKYGKKEVENTVMSYFKPDKSAYVMNKYKNNVSKFGYKSDIFKFFFNIEENFLPEEYHCYNNFFLYLSMRAIGYADAYSKTDRLFVNSVIMHLSDLVYHRFENSEDEKIFIGVICSIEDILEDYRDLFIESNISYKENPIRKAEEKKIHDMKLSNIRGKLDAVSIPYTEEDTFDILTEKYDTFIKDTINAETKKKTKNTEEVDLD